MTTDVYLIFLDIDGVMFDPSCYGVDYYTQHVNYPNLVPSFDQCAVSNLRCLIDRVKWKTDKDVFIVLSSAWRNLGNLEYILQIFEQHYFSKFIIDKTPCIELMSRDLEIYAWLEMNKKKYNIINYVILDDNDINLSGRFGKKFIHCTSLFDIDAYNKSMDMLLQHDHNKKSIRKKYIYYFLLTSNLVSLAVIFYLLFI